MTRIPLIGLPGTGKSTYIGALWHMVEEPSIEDVMEGDLPGDRRHPQMLAAKVRGLDELERTKHDDDEAFDVPVSFAGAGLARLRIPDRSGEQLQTLIERRHWPELLRAELQDAAALLLFIHPDQLRPPLPLRLVTSALASTDEAVRDGSQAAEQDEFSPARACTAAQLIDGLENILEEMESVWPVRVGVVISAFDRVHDRTPDDWLKEKLPSVRSFLATNEDRAQWTVFGVSAQGGRREDRVAVLESGDLHERAWARGASGVTVPLSEPVRWALGWR